MSVYAKPDVVNECLSPPTSSSCRCKALVHRGGAHIVWLARPFTCEGLASQTSTQYYSHGISSPYRAPLLTFSPTNALLTSRFKLKRVRYSELGCKGHVNTLHGLLCSVANNDSRTGTGRVTTFISEVILSDILFDNY